MVSTFFDICMSSANFMKSEIGSDPAESTKIRGVTMVASL